MTSEEARTQLGSRLICPEQQWIRKGSMYLLESGVLDITGKTTGLFISLQAILGPKPSYSKFRFALQKREKWENDPVYQLHIVQIGRPLPSIHAAPHEHLGDLRVEGSSEWLHWKARDVLCHFCTQINMGFDPPLSLPEWA